MAGSWSDFKHEILEMADLIRRAQSVIDAESTPSQVHADLYKLDKGISKALQVFVELDLAHKGGQDLEVDPFNWPAVQAIQFGRYAQQPQPIQEDETYPTKLIQDMRDLRDAARRAQAMFKPGPGNSSQRGKQAFRADSVGKNFVRIHREHFGRAPPMSESGKEIDLLSQALEDAGIPHDVAIGLAPGVMRRSIENAAVWRGERPPRPRRNRAK